MTEKVSTLIRASPFVSARSVSDEVVSGFVTPINMVRVETLKQVQRGEKRSES
jgi:hypothetical protein